MKVLIADHDSFSRSIYSKRFEQSAFEVVTAGNGEACLRQAHAHHPDVILLELALPRMDGFRVLASLRMQGETAKVPVVPLTALAEQEDIDRCARFGCPAFFIKPHADPERVVEVVKRIVAS